MARLYFSYPPAIELTVVVAAALGLVFGLMLFTRDLAAAHPDGSPFVLGLQRLLLASGGLLGSAGVAGKAILAWNRVTPSDPLRIFLMTVAVLGVALLTSAAALRLD